MPSAYKPLHRWSSSERSERTVETTAATMGACPSNLPRARGRSRRPTRATATSSPSVRTSRRARCWRPTGGGCSRWPSTSPGVARLRRHGVVVARPAWRAAARRAAGDPLDATVRPALRGAGRHRVRRGRRRAARTRDGTGGWIDDDIVAAYTELHRLGWAHSVEAWRDGELAGGLYGVAIGGLFAGESMFTRVRDASKVALMGLVDLLTDEYAERPAARHPVADPAPRHPGRGRDPATGVPRPGSSARCELPLPAAFA